MAETLQGVCGVAKLAGWRLGIQPPLVPCWPSPLQNQDAHCSRTAFPCGFKRSGIKWLSSECEGLSGTSSSS